MNSNMIDAIGYKGTVNVTIVDRDKVINKFTCHNNGTNNLFNFLSNCIAGNYINHELYRPCKIALYSQGEGSTDIISTNTRTTEFIYQDSVARVVPKEGTNAGYDVIFHFRIPFVKIFSNRKITHAALWPSIIDEQSNGYSAFVAFSPQITIPNNVTSTWTIIVDWKLELTNKSTE